MELSSPSQDSFVRLNEIQNELAMCRSALEIASHKATLITQDGKSSVLAHINTAFAALLTLASHVSGDYDSRSRNVSKTGVVATLPTLLWTSAKDALTKSDAVAIAAKTESIMGMNTRPIIASMRERINSARAGVDAACNTRDQEAADQRAFMGDATARLAAARKAYDKAIERMKSADEDADWYQEYEKQDDPMMRMILEGSRPDRGPPTPGNSPELDRQVVALQARETAKAAEERLNQAFSDVEAQRTASHRLQVRRAQLDMALAQAGLVDQLVSTCLQDCEKIVAICQEAERVMLHCKENMATMLSRCNYLDQLSAQGDYVQTKADYAGMILECIIEGMLDGSLVDLARAVLETLEAGDETNLLQQEPFAKHTAVINTLLIASTVIRPLSKA